MLPGGYTAVLQARSRDEFRDEGRGRQAGGDHQRGCAVAVASIDLSRRESVFGKERCQRRAGRRQGHQGAPVDEAMAEPCEAGAKDAAPGRNQKDRE